ncbi:hypothetical protein EYF80_008848 [Liparis tanakae]|uniref:Uncharacterized protein n=1 Tax=Liparis tanakae TaxID=230148 RepID=A0A4Z2IUF0_9TELE|nr:hypothetical protein EYF80_008848 [Liparis tanakae]
MEPEPPPVALKPPRGRRSGPAARAPPLGPPPLGPRRSGPAAVRRSGVLSMWERDGARLRGRSLSQRLKKNTLGDKSLPMKA